jgi:tetratricopeptide (TPR) repeat protein
VRASYHALAELKPARYGKSERGEETLTTSAFTGAAADTAADIDAALAARAGGKLADADVALWRGTGREGNVNTAVAWDELGITLRMEGKFAEARSAYEQAIAANADYAPAHRNLGVLLDLYLGEPAAALEQFERYRQLGGEDKPVSSWIAELRARTGVKPPASGASAPETTSPPDTTADDKGGTT